MSNKKDSEKSSNNSSRSNIDVNQTSTSDSPNENKQYARTNNNNHQNPNSGGPRGQGNLNLRNTQSLHNRSSNNNNNSRTPPPPRHSTPPINPPLDNYPDISPEEAKLLGPNTLKGLALSAAQSKLSSSQTSSTSNNTNTSSSPLPSAPSFSNNQSNNNHNNSSGNRMLRSDGTLRSDNILQTHPRNMHHQQVGYQPQPTFVQQPIHMVVNQQGIPIYPQQYIQYQQGPPAIYQQRGGQYVQMVSPSLGYNPRGSPITNNSPQQVGMQRGVIPVQYMNHPQYINPQMTEQQHLMPLRQQQLQGQQVYLQQPIVAPSVTPGQIPILGTDGQPIVVVPQIKVQQPSKPVEELVAPQRKKIVIKDKDGNPIDLKSYKKEITPTEIPTIEKTIVAVNKSTDNLSLSPTISAPSNSKISIEEINSTINDKIEIQNNIKTEVNIQNLPLSPPEFAVSTQPQFPVKVSPIPPSPHQVTPVIPKPEFKVHVAPAPVFSVHVPIELKEIEKIVPTEAPKPSFGVFTVPSDLSPLSLTDKVQSPSKKERKKIAPYSSTNNEKDNTDNKDSEINNNKISNSLSSDSLSSVVSMDSTDSSILDKSKSNDNSDDNNLTDLTKVKITTPPPTTTSPLPSGGKVKRSLKPNAGKDLSLRQFGKKDKIIEIKYSKDDLINWKSVNLNDRPSACSSYINVLVVEEFVNSTVPNKIKVLHSDFFNRQVGYGFVKQVPVTKERTNSYSSPSKGEKSQQQEQKDNGWERGKSAPAVKNSHVVVDKDTVVASPVAAPKLSKQNSTSNSPPPTFKTTFKKVNPTDRLEKLSVDVTSILNKITPDTAEKLTNKLINDIPITSSAMLDKLISLIFEKALLESTFAEIYADICSKLEKESKYWEFLQVVHNLDLKEYFWIKDLEFNSFLAGPCHNISECINATKSVVLPQMVKVSFKPKFVEILVVNKILLTIYKNPNNDDYFYSYLLFNEIDSSSISDKKFKTLQEAQVDVTKKNSFRRRLLIASQQEYDNSMKNEGKYGEFEKYKRVQIEKISKLSGEEKFEQQKLLDEQIMFLKKRKLGNIQFIGVLCKKSLLKVSNVVECIETLIEGDEDYLESLCHLLRTVGSTLETNISGQIANRLEISFEKLSNLAKNKNINSRIRFGIDEILELRKNQWIARRAHEGPARISEIEERERIDKEKKDNFNNNSIKISSNLQQDRPISRQSSLGGHQTLTGNIPSARFSSNVSRNLDNRNNNGEAIIRTKSESAIPQTNKRLINNNSSSPVKSNQNLSPEVISRRVSCVIEEYLYNSDINEVIETLKELPKSSVETFIKAYIEIIINKYIGGSSNKSIGIGNVRSKLKSLLESSFSLLLLGKDVIIQCLEKNEYVRLLHESIMDNKNTPELLGEIVKIFIKSKLINFESFNSIIISVKFECSKDDCYDMKDIDSIYDRLIKSLN